MSTPVSFSGGAFGTVYNWTNTNTGIGLGAGGSSNIGSFTTINNGASPAAAIITVTPTNGGCSGAATDFTITVKPTAQVNQPANQVFCIGVNTRNISFSTNNNIGTTTYTWTNDNTSIGLAASGTGDIAPFNPVNNGSSPVTATITVTPSLNGCSGIPKTFTITINTIPPGAFIANNNGLALNCTILNTTLTASGNGSYLWSTGATTPSVSVNTPGTFK